MTEGIEHAIETAVGSILFCTAVLLLLWLHTAFARQSEVIGRMPERLILFEETREEWRHLEE